MTICSGALISIIPLTPHYGGAHSAMLKEKPRINAFDTFKSTKNIGFKCTIVIEDEYMTSYLRKLSNNKEYEDDAE